MLERVAKKPFFRPGPTSRPWLFALGLLVVVLSSLGLTVSAQLASASVTDLELSVHQLVNEHRTAQGLTPLAFSPEISAGARQHSQDMASGRVKFGHDGFSNRTGGGEHSAENVTKAQTAQRAVSAWLNSSGHRRNIEGQYNLTGIGVAPGRRGYFFTQIFSDGGPAQPRTMTNAAPAGRARAGRERNPPPPPLPAAAVPPPTSHPPSASPPSEPAGEGVPAALELYVHMLVNEHRAEQGLTPLAFSPEISDIARYHSEDMASGRLPGGHDGADERAEKISKSIPYLGVGENVAAINKGGEGGEGAAAVSGWLQSPGHRSNLEGDFDLTGIGIAHAEDGTYFFTQFFVRTAGDPPGTYGNDPPPLPAHVAMTVPPVMATNGNAPQPPPAPAGRERNPAHPPPSPAPAPQARATWPAYSEKDPRRRPGRRRTAATWVQKLEPRKRHPEKDPRRRPGRRRTAGGWVQKLE